MAFFVVAAVKCWYNTDPFWSAYLIIGLFISISVGMVTVIAGAVPCMLAEYLAGLLRVRTTWYFVICATITAAALGPAELALLGPRLLAEHYRRSVVSTAPFFALQGALCGLVYGLVSNGGRTAWARLAQRQSESASATAGQVETSSSGG